ncbi:MAG TPA: hypothetical protein VHC70_14665, partial [Phycisphaerales bacterium]|nr:hypothetical protein [Phycisphaerales bacterium]
GTIIPPPASVPVLALRRSDPGAHALLAMDGSSERAGKPDRVAALVVFRAVADGPVRRPEEGAYLGLFTRPRFASNVTAADRGKTATYFARWANAKGEPGPWSNALSVAIAA